MGREQIGGTLIGVRDGFDGPMMVIEIMGQERKYPLACEISIDFAFSRMNTRVVCQMEDGKVTKVE